MMQEPWAKLFSDVGAIREATETLKAEVHALRADVSALKGARAAIRGGWKVLSVVGSIGGAVGAILARAFWH